jgi:hypothetical protein
MILTTEEDVARCVDATGRRRCAKKLDNYARGRVCTKTTPKRNLTDQKL